MSIRFPVCFYLNDFDLDADSPRLPNANHHYLLLRPHENDNAASREAYLDSHGAQRFSRVHEEWRTVNVLHSTGAAYWSLSNLTVNVCTRETRVL